MLKEYDKVIWDDADNPCKGGQCKGFVRKGTLLDNLGHLVVYWTIACKTHIDHEYRESDPITSKHVKLRKVT